MKKIFAVAFIIAGIACFAQDAQQKKQAASVVAENRRIATTLPARVIDPRTYQNTRAPIRFAETRSLVQRGYKILEYNNGKSRTVWDTRRTMISACIVTFICAFRSPAKKFTAIVGEMKMCV